MKKIWKPWMLLAVTAMSITACSQNPIDSKATSSPVSPSPSSPVPVAQESLVAQRVEGLPFSVRVPEGAADQVTVIVAPGGYQAAQGVDYTLLGETGPTGNLPGPTARVVLDDGTTFGSRMLKPREGELTDLSDIASAPGIISQQGIFTALVDLPNVKEMIPLKASNPQNLYFEPQHASTAGDWVVWREASAGEPNAMPSLSADDWRLVAWNQASGDVYEVASAFLLHGLRFAPYASWDVAPSTDGTNVYFEATLPRKVLSELDLGEVIEINSASESEEWGNAIISIPLDSPGQVHFVSEGTMPVADSRGAGGVHWIDRFADSTVMQASGEQTVSVFGVQGDSTWDIVRLAGSGSLLAATVVDTQNPRAWLLVWDLNEERLVAAIDTGSDWAEVSVSGESFVWGNATGNGDPTMFLWQASLQNPIVLGQTQGLSVPMLNGSIIALPVFGDEGEVRWQILQRVGVL